MMKWISDNLVLVLGMSLPLLLMLVFAGVRAVNAHNVAPPAHAILLAPAYGRGYDLNIDDSGKLSIKLQSRAAHMPAVPPRTEIGLFTPATGEWRHFTLQSDKPPAPDRDIKINTPPELAALRFTADKTAPDGYKFSTARSNGNLIVDIFGTSRYGRHTLTNGRRTIHIPESQGIGSPYKFIGWVIPE